MAIWRTCWNSIRTGIAGHRAAFGEVGDGVGSVDCDPVFGVDPGAVGRMRDACKDEGGRQRGRGGKELSAGGHREASLVRVAFGQDAARRGGVPALPARS